MGKETSSNEVEYMMRSTRAIVIMKETDTMPGISRTRTTVGENR